MPTSTNERHIPVMVKEVLSILDVKPNDTVIDCTLGAGGHAEAFANAVGRTGFVLGIERNPKTFAETHERLKRYEQFAAVNANFRNLDEIIERERMRHKALRRIDHIFFDLGVSSMELEDPDFGGSFQRESVLNMRLDLAQESPTTPTAKTIVNRATPKELIHIFQAYGDMENAAAVSEAIIDARETKNIETTTELAKIVEKVPSNRRRSIHPATTAFQALRIAVNDELNALREALQSAIEVIEPNGTIACLSFHSKEDRIVKDALKEASRSCTCPPGQPTCTCSAVPTLELMTKKAATPTEEELRANPRSRSAKLRAARKRTAEEEGKRAHGERVKSP